MKPRGPGSFRVGPFELDSSDRVDAIAFVVILLAVLVLVPILFGPTPTQ